jgi:hypothetical protein
MIFDEMVKNLREENDNKETDKMLNAIHRQAYFKRVEEENKRMLANMAKKEKEAKKQERKQAIIDRVKYEAEMAFLLLISTPLFLMLFFMMTWK